MKSYRTLEIRGDIQLLNKVMSNFTQVKKGLFTYKKRFSEDYSLSYFSQKGKAACFGTNSKRLYCSTVWLVQEDNKIYVINIVPKTKSWLSLTEYNDILQLFYENVVKTSGIRSRFIRLSKSDISIEDILSKTVCKELIRWENLSNRDSGGVSHQCDYERWMRFIVLAYRRKAKIDRSQLEEWLLTDKGWRNVEYVKRLGDMFEYGIDLLRFYNNKV